MKHAMKFSSLFTSLIAVFMVANLEKPYNYFQGVPSHQVSWFTWEEQVFNRSLKKLQKHEPLYEINLKNQITQSISVYKTGLKKDHLERKITLN